MWKKRIILTAVSIIHLQPILKEKREGAPEWNFYRLRKWIMGRVAWIKTDQFLWWWLVFFFASVSRWEAKAEKRRNRKKGGRETKGEAQREKEREREKESEEEKEESGGGTQRGKWCSKKPASTLDWFNPGFNTQGDHPPQNYSWINKSTSKMFTMILFHVSRNNFIN